MVASLLMMGYITFDPASGKISSSVLDINAIVKWCVQVPFSLYSMALTKYTAKQYRFATVIATPMNEQKCPKSLKIA